jgi:ribosome-binding protein aMBF1 (putative translation factor)
MPKKAKRVTTKKEAAEIGEAGRFALHLDSLLKERGLTSVELAKKCTDLEIQEYTIRSWLRGDSMPRAHHLRPLAKILGLKDLRHILPE